METFGTDSNVSDTFLERDFINVKMISIICFIIIKSISVQYIMWIIVMI